MFFLQNIMMSQTSLQSQFNPEHDTRSKKLQGFMMQHMLSSMTQQRERELASIQKRKEQDLKKDLYEQIKKELLEEQLKKERGIQEEAEDDDSDSSSSSSNSS